MVEQLVGNNVSNIAARGPASDKGTPTLTVRLKYEDGEIEDHILRNGEHFADDISRVDVEKSKFADPVRGQQLRYLTVTPKRSAKIATMDLIKGNAITSPVVMAITIEGPSMRFQELTPADISPQRCR